MHHAIVSTDWHYLPLELKFKTASHLETLKDCASFSQTCKEHSQHISVDALLSHTNLSHFISCTDHTKALIHYSKKEFPLDKCTSTIDTTSNNYKKISFLINTEDEKKRLSRVNTLNFFGYDNSSVIHTIKAYQAIKNGKKTFKNSSFQQAVHEENPKVLKVIFKNYHHLMGNFILKQTKKLLRNTSSKKNKNILLPSQPHNLKRKQSHSQNNSTKQPSKKRRK